MTFLLFLSYQMTFCQISMEDVVWSLKHDSMCSLCLLEMHSLVNIEPAQRQNQVPTSHSWAIIQFWSQICKVMYLHWISIYNHSLKSTASLNDFMSFCDNNEANAIDNNVFRSLWAMSETLSYLVASIRGQKCSKSYCITSL